PTFLFFFFSSRRRHTRFSRDWSSDVCSSDLHDDLTHFLALREQDAPRDPQAFRRVGVVRPDLRARQFAERDLLRAVAERDRAQRSEERRVGKEGRYGRAAGHETKEIRNRETQ